MHIVPIINSLPDLAFLAVAAEAEGHVIVARLIADWDAGKMRFNGTGEALMSTVDGGQIIGVGGITQEPSDPTMLRMRRFYVHPLHRRRGIATVLAGVLLDAPKRQGTIVAVHVGMVTAAPFWEALGFEPVAGQPYSHVLNRPR